MPRTEGRRLKLRILVVGAGVSGISVARGSTARRTRRHRLRPAAERDGGRWCRDHLVQRRDGSRPARRRHGRRRPAAVHRAGHDIHRSPARHDGPRRDGEPAGRTHSDGPTSNPAGAAAHRLSDRSHPMQLPCGRGDQYPRRGAGRLRGRQLGRRGSADRCRRPALGGSRYRRRATREADRLVQLAGTGHSSRHRRPARRDDDDRRARKPRHVAGRRFRPAVVVRLTLVA